MHLQKGQTLINEGEDTDCIYIVENGGIEVFKEFENNVFVTERMGQGSTIGHNNIFTDDIASYTFTANQSTHILKLTESSLNVLQQEYPDFGKKVLMYQHTILRNG